MLTRANDRRLEPLMAEASLFHGISTARFPRILDVALAGY